VPPRVGAPGRLTVIAADAIQSVELKFPTEPKQSVRLAQRGMWLEGFEQRGPEELGGWIEAGGPVLGVSIALDGTVEVGKVVERSAEVLLSGRFGLAAAETEGAIESTDGGKSWGELQMPRLPDSPRDATTRGCSPVGCALRNWIRVGWGKPGVAEDLGFAAVPEPAALPTPVLRTVRLRCSLAARARARPAGQAEAVGREEEGATTGSWVSFRGTLPPKLGKDEEGVAKGTGGYETVPAHAYVWGPKGADWSRVGYWQLRFDDRFDAQNGVRSSALSRPPWVDRAAAADGIGLQSQSGYWHWLARLDPAGHAALLSACLGSSCRLYGVAEGRPILPLREATGRSGGLPVPLGQGTVRVGDTWYFLAESSQDTTELWRAELGVAERVTSYARLGRRGFTSGQAPALVRRAFGRELGLLISIPTDPSTGNSAASWAVLPIDLGTGRLTEPVMLGPGDLGGVLPPACASSDDGWLVETELDTPAEIELVGTDNYLDGVELRLRMEPGSVCLQGVAARAGRGFDRAEAHSAHPAPHPSAASPEAPPISLVVREQSSGERWQLWCEPPP